MRGRFGAREANPGTFRARPMFLKSGRIAVKCRDLKARLLVGELQKDVFGNKIQLVCWWKFETQSVCDLPWCGFAFFFRLLYAVLITISIGLVWAWFNLKGLEIRLNRNVWHGYVGDSLTGELQIINHFRLPKSWISVKEISTIPGYTSGRAIGLVQNQRRSWLIDHQLLVRGKYLCGEIEVTSQDPFGLFQLKRSFLSTREFTVFPRTELLPDLSPQLASLPSDSKSGRRRRPKKKTTLIKMLL